MTALDDQKRAKWELAAIAASLEEHPEYLNEFCDEVGIDKLTVKIFALTYRVFIDRAETKNLWQDPRLSFEHFQSAAAVAEVFDPIATIVLARERGFSLGELNDHLQTSLDSMVEKLRPSLKTLDGNHRSTIFKRNR